MDFTGTTVRAIDGDTLIFSADLGFNIFHSIRVRLSQVDAPEMDTPKGVLAKRILGQYCMLPAKLKTIKLDRYGRWISEIVLVRPGGGKDRNLNEIMINEIKKLGA